MTAYFNAALGRWQVRLPDGRRAYRYRQVMEAHLGRRLRPDEHVHHINGDPADDRIENLQVLSVAEHTRLHHADNEAARRAKWKYTWSTNHSCCQECGTTERRHGGKGLCERCYFRLRAREIRGGGARVPATVVSLVCEQCGGSFERTLKQNGGIRRYCSVSCASTAKAHARWKKHRAEKKAAAA